MARFAVHPPREGRRDCQSGSQQLDTFGPDPAFILYRTVSQRVSLIRGRVAGSMPLMGVDARCPSVRRGFL